MKFAMIAIPLLGGALSFGVPQTSYRTAPLLQRIVAEAPSRSCEGGAAYPLETSLVPKTIQSTTGITGEILELELEVKHSFKGETRVVYVLDIVTDTGRLVSSGTPTAPIVANSDKTHRFTLRTPRFQEDGFYVVRAVIAGKETAGIADERTVETYWSVQEGKLAQMEYPEWFHESAMSKGVAL